MYQSYNLLLLSSNFRAVLFILICIKIPKSYLRTPFGLSLAIVER